jgi:hypothetical protein
MKRPAYSRSGWRRAIRNFFKAWVRAAFSHIPY